MTSPKEILMAVNTLWPMLITKSPKRITKSPWMINYCSASWPLTPASLTWCPTPASSALHPKPSGSCHFILWFSSFELSWSPFGTPGLASQMPSHEILNSPWPSLASTSSPLSSSKSSHHCHHHHHMTWPLTVHIIRRHGLPVSPPWLPLECRWTSWPS